MTRKYLESLDQEGGDVVEPDVYTAEVVDARALEDKAFLWVDLKIEGGPDDGRVVSVGVNIPDDSASRGAIFHFKKKIRAFSRTLLDNKVFDLPDEEQPAKIAELLIGERAEVKLDIEKEGAYKGTQQLIETNFVGDAAPAAAPAAQTKIVEPTTPPAQVQPQPVVEAEAEEPVSVPDTGDDGEDDLPF